MRDWSDWQRLEAHLLNVARLSGKFGEKTGLGRVAYVAGLFHDLGKYDPAFQAYIAGKGASVEHSTAGAQVLCDMAQGPDKAMAELIAYAILRHHAGLPDRDNDVGGSFSLRMEQPLRMADAWQKGLGNDVAARISGMGEELRRFVVADREPQCFTLSFVGRMIFSCLVDAEAWIETRVLQLPFHTRPGRLLRRGVRQRFFAAFIGRLPRHCIKLTRGAMEC